MTPETIRAIASQAGEETGMCYPSAGNPWVVRFVELVEMSARNGSEDNSRFVQEALHESMRENEALRNALNYYATDSNWKREVRHVHPCVNWTKPPVAFDRGAMAKFVLLTLGEK